MDRLRWELILVVILVLRIPAVKHVTVEWQEGVGSGPVPSQQVFPLLVRAHTMHNIENTIHL